VIERLHRQRDRVVAVAPHPAGRSNACRHQVSHGGLRHAGARRAI
jgi:hypothetical protein